jgi:ubiquinone/menaquinone biosynthesis C-methylase UbiE
MKNKINAKIITLLNFELDKKYEILDFGCGSGLLLETIKNSVGNGSKLIGLDSDAKTIEQTKKAILI